MKLKPTCIIRLLALFIIIVLFGEFLEGAVYKLTIAIALL